MKKLIVLSGAGISQESGIKTFRDADGLWNNHRIEEVEPNDAHRPLAELEKSFDVMLATSMVKHADIFLVVGTSLQVYPTAGLLQYVPGNIPKYFMDPQAEPINFIQNLTIIREKATAGVKKFIELLNAYLQVES